MEKLSRIANKKKYAQSAMEYLMTYGWAILIISVVLVVLFSLGITNPLFFAPKATAGGCQVVRPNGPGTTSFISLEGGGVCNELPRYVASFTNSGPIEIENVAKQWSTYKEFTISFWVYVNHPSTYLYPKAVGIEGSGAKGGWIISLGGYDSAFVNMCFDSVSGWSGCFLGTDFQNNTWTNIAYTININKDQAILYINGKEVASDINLPTYNYAASSQNFFIGPESPYASFANVQFYNAILSQTEIQGMYVLGIGGAPINLQNLVGWWPLNGNANDYSGNNNDGTASNVIWSGTWWQSYTQP